MSKLQQKWLVGGWKKNLKGIIYGWDTLRDKWLWKQKTRVSSLVASGNIDTG